MEKLRFMQVKYSCTFYRKDRDATRSPEFNPRYHTNKSYQIRPTPQKKYCIEVCVHLSKPSTWEAEARRLRGPGQRPERWLSR